MNTLCPICLEPIAKVPELNICHIREGQCVCRTCCAGCKHHKEHNSCGYVEPDPTLELREKIGPLNAQIYHLEQDIERYYKQNKPKYAESALARIRSLENEVRRIKEEWDHEQDENKTFYDNACYDDDGEYIGDY